MANAIIILILIILLSIGVKSSIRHFKGEGSCCSGGSGSVKAKRRKKKRLSGPAAGSKTVQIQGMHCNHCVQSVTREINKIDGASAKVSLRKQKAVVFYDRELDDAALIGAVEKAGFQVVSIQP